MNYEQSVTLSLKVKKICEQLNLHLFSWCRNKVNSISQFLGIPKKLHRSLLNYHLKIVQQIIPPNTQYTIIKIR